MRLRYLLFPFAIVISLVIFFNFGWPKIDIIKNAKNKKNENIAKLADLAQKKEKVQKLKEQLVKNVVDKQTIENYLPKQNMEERVVGGINYLASDAGVALVNVSLTKPNEKYPNKSASSKTNSKEAEKEMQFSEATILIIGEYEKIQTFFDKLQTIPMFHSIKSLTIENKEEKTDNDKILEAEDVPSVDSLKSLSVNAVVKFGFLEYSDADSQIDKFKPSLDTETISTLKAYLSPKDASIVGEKEKGKKNPFFLE